MIKWCVIGAGGIADRRTIPALLEDKDNVLVALMEKNPKVGQTVAKKYGVQMVVRSSLNESEGTTVKEVVKMEKMLVSGVAADPDAARVAVIGLKDEPGVAFKLFNALAKKNINDLKQEFEVFEISKYQLNDIRISLGLTGISFKIILIKESLLNFFTLTSLYLIRIL